MIIFMKLYADCMKNVKEKKARISGATAEVVGGISRRAPWPMPRIWLENDS